MLNQKSAVYNNQNNENLQSAHSNESVSDTATIKSSESVKTEETDRTDLSSDLSNLSATSSNSPSQTPPPAAAAAQHHQPLPTSSTPIESKPKKESGFLNKCKSVLIGFELFMDTLNERIQNRKLQIQCEGDSFVINNK